MIAHFWKLYNTPSLMLSRWDHFQLEFLEFLIAIPFLFLAFMIYKAWIKKWLND